MILTYLFLLAVNTIHITCGDKAGARLTVKESFLNWLKDEFTGLVIAYHNRFPFPDQHVKTSVGSMEIEAQLSQLELDIVELSAQNLAVALNEPNLISLTVQGVAMKGQGLANIQLGVYKETDDVEVHIKIINFALNLTLSSVPSDTDKTKLLPFVSVSNSKLELDFDLDVKGTSIAGIINILKSRLKMAVNFFIQNHLSNLLQEQLAKLIPQMLQRLPLYFPILNSGLSLDYLLAAEPKIVNHNLIISSNAGIVNPKIPETMNTSAQMPDSMPEYDENGKDLQVFLTEYSINTALNTLFLSNFMKLVMTSESMPKKIPVKLNTTVVDILINGIFSQYGMDKPVMLNCTVNKLPVVSIAQDELRFTASSAECGIYVLLDNNTYDQAIRFNTSIDASLSVKVAEGVVISAKIDHIKIQNSQLILSKVQEANINNVEQLFNFLFRAGRTQVNKLLENVQYSIPSLMYVNVSNMTLATQDKYLELNVSPKIGFESLHFLADENPEVNQRKGKLARLFKL